MASNKNIFITFAVLVLSVLFFGLTEFDQKIQNLFFNFQTHQWLLPAKMEPYKFIFYDGIKKLLIVISVLFLFSLAFYRISNRVKNYKKGILVIVLSAIIIPSVVGTLKSQTNMPCPRDEIIYGGIYPKTPVWQSYQDPLLKQKQNKCWPAGHASGGFALLSFAFLFRKKRNQYLAITTALVVGWSMGTYKMIIGDHFFSHTFITMVLAWLIVLFIARVVKVEEEETKHAK